MGLFDKLGDLLSSKKKEAKVLCIGLDNSGKSTIINSIKANDFQVSVIQPTTGFNTEKVSIKGMLFTIFDMSGGTRYRNLWEHYFSEVDAVIFVVDVSDKMRVVVAKEELDFMLAHDDFKPRNIPILLLANKVDLQGGASVGEIKCDLELDKIRSKKWNIIGCNGKNGDGVETGFDWLIQAIRENNSD